MPKKLFIVIISLVTLLGTATVVLFFKQNKAVELGDPIQGSDTAAVKIVVYSDFACSSCHKMANFLKQAQTEFGDQLAVQFKDYPLTPINPNAQVAAEAGQCALAQNLFWPYHDLLFEHQAEWAPERDPSEQFLSYAANLNLDTVRFQHCLTQHQQREAVQADLAQGQGLNLYQTPTLYINGQQYTGVSSYDSLAKKIRDNLSQ